MLHILILLCHETLTRITTNSRATWSLVKFTNLFEFVMLCTVFFFSIYPTCYLIHLSSHVAPFVLLLAILDRLDPVLHLQSNLARFFALLQATINELVSP